MKKAKTVQRGGLVILLLFLALVFSHSSTPSHFWENRSDDALIDELVASMSDEELLGQVFFLGYVGTAPSAEIKRWISRRNLGGVKIFTRNVGTLESLAGDIRELQLLTQDTRFRIPLLVATDQEGGWVKHIRRETSTSGGNLSLGAGGLPHDAFLTGYYIGEELKALGINMNFAPTLDVYSNPEADAVGARSFSSDPVSSGVMGAAYIQGQKKAGVISTGKHFPGHGDADQDSHGYLPVIMISRETLNNRELVPYRIAVREGLPAVMSAHLAFPLITGDKTPASLSPVFLKEILRGQLGFEGLVVTDDMEMNGAIMNGDSIPDACRKALAAGNDMILVSHTPAIQERVWERLLFEIKTDASFRRQIETGARRVLTLKIKTFKGPAPFPYIPDPAEVSVKIPAAGAGGFFFESVCRGIAEVRKGVIPYQPRSGEKLIIISQYSEFLEEGKRRYPAAETLTYSWEPMYTPREGDVEHVRTRAAAADTVIFCLANPNGLGILKTLKPLGGRIIVISALTPVYLSETPWVKTAIAVFGNSSAAFRAGFAALKGDFSPEGGMPIQFLTEETGESLAVDKSGAP